MSIEVRTICNRCKTVFVHRELPRFGNNSRTVMASDMRFRNTYTDEDQHRFDLCSNCTSEFESFMNP